MSPETYRPLTILNDYKLLTRIIANRLRPWMDNILHRKEFCGRISQSSTQLPMCETIAYAEESNKPICLLSIDFKDAFDKISDTYLFKILWEYGISDQFCSRLQTIYADATSTLILNGHKSSPIRVEWSATGMPT